MNTVGWFNCSCNDGYTLDLDGYSCNGKRPIDTSRNKIIIQNPKESCMLIKACTMQDLRCVVTAVDVDECEVEGGEMLHNCSLLATCNNTIGSFECRCNEGFDGDGVDCQGEDIYPAIYRWHMYTDHFFFFFMFRC